jgi:hypothetical protein
MNSNKVTNLATGTISGDGVNFAQFNTPTFGGAVVCSSTLLVTGATTLSGAAVANTFSSSGATITGGAIDGTTIGTTTRSTVKATTLDLGLSTQSAAIGQGDSSSLKNRIINGAMVIDQRNAGASVTPTDGQYLLDRWQVEVSQTSKLSVQQNAGSVTPPVGFTNYLGVTSLSAYSIVASDYFTIEQRIEGFNIADLGWGTANAKTITLSFWVYSSLTGTFGGSLVNSGNSRSYPFTYTISAANTWEQKTITVAGDTSGTWLRTNGIGMIISLSLGMGSTLSGTAGAWAATNYLSATAATSVVGTSGATFYITGVQLEVGSQATGFEYRQYQQELALCQRYYYRQSASTSFAVFLNGFNNTTTRLFGIFNFPQMLRATPVLETTGTASNYQVLYAGGNDACTAVTLDGQTTNFSAFVLADVASGLTAGQGAILRANNTTSAYLGYSSEL